MFDAILGFFITSAHAAETAATTSATTQPPAGSNFSLLVMGVVFLLFMYFVMLRPQSKRAKEQRDLLGSLAKGDEVTTAGGIVGKISKITDSYVVIAVNETSEITVQKTSVITVLPKGTLKSI